MNQIIKENRDPFQYKNNKELFENKVKSVCALWILGEIYASFDYASSNDKAVIFITFAKKYKKQITHDYNKDILPFYQENNVKTPVKTIKKQALL
jgi:hypothetical protein